MKISIVASSTGWHSDQLFEAAKKRGIELETVNIESINDIKALNKSLGQVIIWRSASISPSMDRTILLNLLKDKYLINHSVIQPLLSYKLYQQKIITGKTALNGIPTFKFKNKKEVLAAIDANILKYPFIQKPNLGSKGEGVVLIKSKEDLMNQGKSISIDDEDSSKQNQFKVSEQVYQNFIKNNGDFRILMLGGKALGVMKRIAAKDSFLNNISRGGKAERIEDPEIIKEVTSIARTVAATLDLTFCGVDVIRNEETGEYHFLEVNTAPQWQGFQATFPEINVAEHLIDHCINLGERESRKSFDLVKEYYDKNYQFLGEKKFHYSSRMYFWTKEEIYKNQLDAVKENYLGNSDEEIIEKLKEKLTPNDRSKNKTLSKELREKYFEKYPQLSNLNTVLFLNLFAETIYGKDIRPLIKNLVSEDEMKNLAIQLHNDPQAIFILATHAINYFYLLENYFNGSEKITQPEKYLEIGRMDLPEIDLESKIRFKIYILTHCIIGESRFYVKKAQAQVYKEMLKDLEEIIQNHYFSTSLDNKLEFLVCCKLCDYESKLNPIIQDEAANSLSKTGNFVVDTMNLKARNPNNQFPMSEHRNVLYLMGNLSFNI